ncbi:MAG: UDP-4-amino-4,6-dideoxy-N-acetyl-beta-L-altrosamine transaminase [Candidatus Binataceae bacterium]
MTGGVLDSKLLPYGRQLIEEDDIAAVASVLKGDFLTTGPLVKQFEDAFAARIGARHAIACSSGTAGLHLAAIGLDLGPGDVAVVPAMTFVATANVIRFTGAEVAFADVDAETGLLTAETLRQALASAPTAKIKTVMPVHLAGMVADMKAIAAITMEARIDVIEDACHALGATGADGEHIGACARSRLAVFSTHPVKTITTGEGGIVATNDAALAARLRRLRSHGMDYDSARWRDVAAGKDAPWYYEMAEPGYNYRLTDIACALGLSQLKKLDRFVARRATLAARYDRLLGPLAPKVRIPRRAPGTSGWHLYSIKIDFSGIGVTRGAIMRALREVGIGTQVHYIPVHLQPYYRARYGELRLPGAEAYFRNTLSLPLFPAMADADVDRVVEALSKILALR